MRLCGLRGFGLRKHNPIAPLFETGYFPQSKRSWWGRLNDWTPDDALWLLLEIRQRFGDEPYVLIGFSDGATLAHEIAAADQNCAGLIAHSGLWRDPPWLTDAPTLLLRTQGDRTPTYKATGEAFDAYDKANKQVTLKTLPPNDDCLFNHQFANGLQAMASWCRDELDYRLPITNGATA
jgi:pimeloyl-ACP methyl ester carboxylesterase